MGSGERKALLLSALPFALYIPKHSIFTLALAGISSKAKHSHDQIERHISINYLQP